MFHEAKPLTLRRAAIANLPRFGLNPVNVTKPFRCRFVDQQDDGDEGFILPTAFHLGLKVLLKVEQLVGSRAQTQIV